MIAQPPPAGPSTVPTTAAARPPGLPRRTALACAVGLTTAGLCAAAGCGGSPSPSEAPPSAPPSTPVGVGSAGTRLGDAAAVPVGGGTVYQSLEVVVTQPEAGRFEGFSAVCTHTACIVDKVADGLIQCPCHGSRYRLDGTVARGPAPSPLTARPVTVVDGAIVLT